MNRLTAVIATGAALAATPALAATDGGNDKAVWIALGVVFLGAFTAMGGALLALAAKKKKTPPDRG